MNHDETAKKQVKVIDRRWFTADGELRKDLPEISPEASEQPAPANQSTPPAAEAQQKTEAQPKQGGVQFPSRLTFLDLVDFFAQQALALLSGQIPGRGRDVETARYFIDLLGVVQAKTAGHLTPEEARYLEDVLYQLRALYVQRVR